MGLGQSKQQEPFTYGACQETYPCKHIVTINGKNYDMNGIQIYNYCIKHNIPVPDHFMQYAPRDYENCID